MARRSVSFDFLAGRNTVSDATKKVARDLDGLEDHAGKAGRGAGKKFSKGLGDGLNTDRNLFQRSLIKLVTPDPKLFESLRAPMAKGLSTPLGLALAAGLSTALAGALPAAILAATGGGLIALGAFAVRGSTMLKKHFKSAGNVIAESFRQAALPLRGPFLQAIETVAGAMKKLQPQFRGLFEGLKPAIGPVVNGFVGLARNALPGLQAALPGINAAFTQIGARLPGLGKTLGNVLAAISSNLPAIQQGVNLFFTLSEVVLNVAGAFMTLGQSMMLLVKNPLQFLKEKLFGVDSEQKKAAASSEALANSQGHAAIEAQKAGAKQAFLAERLKAAKAAFYQERSAIASVIPMFEGYSAKSDVTKNKILSNLRQEVNAYKNWASNAQTLLRKGADPAVVKALSDKGPQYVAAFVNASGAELRQLNGLFKSRTQAAGSVAVATSRTYGALAGAAMAAAMSASFRPRLIVPRVGTGGAAGPAFKGRRPKAFASGGVIREPVVGVGLRTGTPHTFAERGPETVIPHGRRGGATGGNVTVNVYAHPTNNPAEVGAEVYRVLKEYQRRNSVSLA